MQEYSTPDTSKILQEHLKHFRIPFSIDLSSLLSDNQSFNLPFKSFRISESIWTRRKTIWNESFISSPVALMHACFDVCSYTEIIAKTGDDPKDIFTHYRIRTIFRALCRDEYRSLHHPPHWQSSRAEIECERLMDWWLDERGRNFQRRKFSNPLGIKCHNFMIQIFSVQLQIAGGKQWQVHWLSGSEWSGSYDAWNYR